MVFSQSLEIQKTMASAMLVNRTWPMPLSFGSPGIGCAEILPTGIQLFRQRLSAGVVQKSVKAYATMPKGSLGEYPINFKKCSESMLHGTLFWTTFEETAVYQ